MKQIMLSVLFSVCKIGTASDDQVGMETLSFQGIYESEPSLT